MPPPKTKERRRAVRPRLTISQILDNMQQDADDNYQGNLADNVVSVFNTLNLDDKRTFLRKSLDALWARQIELAQSNLQEITIPTEDGGKNLKINPLEVEHERQTIEELNYQEQLKMKSWGTMVLFIVFILAFVGVIGFSVFYGTHDIKAFEGVTSNFQSFVEILFDVGK